MARRFRRLRDTLPHLLLSLARGAARPNRCTTFFALAMQAITPLVAGLGLGKEVFDAMNTANMGKGLTAGIGIVLLTILLDRLTQGWTQKQQRALGL